MLWRNSWTSAPPPLGKGKEFLIVRHIGPPANYRLAVTFEKAQIPHIVLLKVHQNPMRVGAGTSHNATPLPIRTAAP